MRNALVSLEQPIIASLRALDRALVANGWPPLSEWWLVTFGTFVAAAVRQLVARVGRRGGKSTSLCRFAVAFALSYDMRQITPGDVGIIGIVSVSRDEANQRLRTVKAILDVLGMKWKPIEGGIELVDRPIAFKVFAATLAGVVGGTWILAICDEVARWRDSDTGANPAKEVLASLRPTMATQPGAKLFLSSSPLGMLDAHFDAFEQGDTAFQRVVEAPTWIANPTLTEQETRDLEPDETVWAREYGAVPQSEADTSLLSEMLIDRATRPSLVALPPEAGLYYVAAIDPATRGNAWTLAVATRGVDRKRRIALVKEWRGTKAKPLSSKAVFAEAAALLAPYRLRYLYSDQFAADPLAEIARDAGLTLHLEPWTHVSKAEAYEGLRTMLVADELELPPDAAVKGDLLGIRKRITRNGLQYELAHQGARHSDYAPAIAMVAKHARAGGRLPPKELTTQEKHDETKRAFLNGLRRQRQREERFGRPPSTHGGTFKALTQRKVGQ